MTRISSILQYYDLLLTWYTPGALRKLAQKQNIGIPLRRRRDGRWRCCTPWGATRRITTHDGGWLWVRDKVRDTAVDYCAGLDDLGCLLILLELDPWMLRAKLGPRGCLMIWPAREVGNSNDG